MAELTEVTTKDKLLLQGLIFSSKSKRLALIYIHGLGGDFYGSPAKVAAFARECRRRGFAFFIFNNRGNNTMTGAKKLAKNPKGYKYVNTGRCFEKFEDCVFDLDAFVKEAKKRGYRKIALLGHSTGANKVVYYLSKKPDRSIVRAVLTGPVSDVPSQVKQCGKGYRKLVALAERMVSGRRGDALMPHGSPGWPMSARRFLSLSVAGSPEDVFQYHMENPPYRALKRIRIPVLAVLGGKDECTTMPPDAILKSYRAANPLVETAMIDGALHSFGGKEGRLAEVICAWISG
ncbi:MAG: alpha/beta fold hydrolase [Candidatus Micrarchaeia archaeon]